VHRDDILVMLPKETPGNQTAKIRATVKRLTKKKGDEDAGDRVEYGKVLAIENNALGFWVAMSVIKDLGGVGEVQVFIAGRQVFDDELIEKQNQLLNAFKLTGKIPNYLSKDTKRPMRNQPGLPV